MLFLLLGGVVGLGLGAQTSRPRTETGVKPARFVVSLRAENDVTARAPGRRPRPTDVPVGSVVTSEAPNEFQLYNDYATPERRHASPRIVVHYVERGIDAPP